MEAGWKKPKYTLKRIVVGEQSHWECRRWSNLVPVFSTPDAEAARAMIRFLGIQTPIPDSFFFYNEKCTWHFNTYEDLCD